MEDQSEQQSDFNTPEICLKNTQRKVKRTVPEDEKDDRYWEKRKRNNMAAKRSRENKRVVELSMRHKMRILEEQNAFLRKELSAIKSKFGIPVDHIFYTEDIKDQCHSQVTCDGKRSSEPPYSRRDEVSSPGSPRSSAQAPPQRPADGHYPPYPADYPVDETLDKGSPEECYYTNKKRLAVGRRQQKGSGGFHPIPQALFYGSSYGAQLMWASARCPGAFGGNMQQFYQEYSLNNESAPVVGSSLSPPQQAQYTRYPTPQTPSPHTSRSTSEYHHYKVGHDYLGTYNEGRQSADLSSPREKYLEESHVAPREKRAEQDQMRHSGEAKTRDDHSHAVAKRRISDEYLSNGYGVMNSEQGTTSSNTESHSSAMTQQNMQQAVQWPETRCSPEGNQTGYNCNPNRSEECYYEHRQSYPDESGRMAGNYPSAGDSDQLRRENEDLKIRLRQLFSQVSRMKDIVLPN